MKEKLNSIITIITPSLNQELFIEKTIKSVLSQEGNFFIDYIIADGGSTDNSVEIIKKYDKLLKTKKYPIKCKGIKYRWWSKKDKGQSHAINKGFKIAKGDILAWINSDDFYEPNAFNYIVNKYRVNPKIDLFYGDMYLIDINNNSIIKKTQQGDYKEMVTFNDKNWYIFQPSTFFTKKIIKKIGILDERFNYAFDYDFFIRIFKNGKTLYCPQIFSNFRIWEESKTFLQQIKFKKEKKEVRKKHCLLLIDQKTINEITSYPPFSIIRKKFPKFYKLLKYIFYNFINKLKYKNIN